jgi:predicted nucleic acid-binding protein
LEPAVVGQDSRETLEDPTGREAKVIVKLLLERRGSPIGPLDTLIAAHVLSLGWALASHNCREFRRVRGLKVEDWLE